MEAWTRKRNFLHSDFGEGDLEKRGVRISVGVPTLNEARTIGRIAETLVELKRNGLIDQCAVLDAESDDGTAELARIAGVEVYDQKGLMPSFGSPDGKGDALWRALNVLDGDIICFFDGDLSSFDKHYVFGLAGPILRHPEISFVKSTFDRPFLTSDRSVSEEAGRLTQMTAKPLLEMFFPELTVFHQPLSGQFAARRSLLVELPYTTGYGVDIGLLLDAYGRLGLDGLAQVDIGTLVNRHRPVEELVVMATQVYEAVFLRLVEAGRLTSFSQGAVTVPQGDDFVEREDLATSQRPPVASLP